MPTALFVWLNTIVSIREAILLKLLYNPAAEPVMSDYIMASLNCAKSLLHALRSRPAFNDVSSSERARVQAVLASSPLTSDHLSEIATTVKTIGFAEIDESLLLDFIGGLCIKPAGGIVQPGTPSQLQNWEAVVHYLPQQIWIELQAGNSSPALDFVVRMGLRHPSEATARAISLMVLCGSDGFEKTQSMEPKQKLIFLQSVKQMLKDRRKAAAPPAVFIALLPATPKDLSDQNPVLFKQWYGEGGAPMASPVSDVQFSQLKASFRLRVMRSSPYAAIPSQMTGTTTPFDMMQAGMQMMQQMQQTFQGGASSSQAPLMNFRRSPASLQFRSAMPLSNGELQLDNGEMLGSGMPLAVEAPPTEVALATVQPVAANASASNPPAAAIEKVDEITAAVLGKMSGAKGKAKAKAEGKAKGTKGTPKAKAKAKAVTDAKVLKDAKVMKKPAAADPCPPMPKLGPMTAIKYLTCSIYACNSSRVWRIIEKSNTRKDYKVSWKEGKAAWALVLAKCRELSE
jgi:hypothetical protein